MTAHEINPDEDARSVGTEICDGGRGRAVRDHEPAALIERLSAIREELLEVAEGWRPWIEGRDSTSRR